MRCGKMALVLVVAGLGLPAPTAFAERLVVPPEIAREPGEPPRVLRGSAIPPRPLAADLPPPRAWQVAAGQRLWLVDPVRGEVVTCRLRATSTVGQRVIACRSGDLPARVGDLPWLPHGAAATAPD
jgi:hypothetical protein